MKQSLWKNVTIVKRKNNIYEIFKMEFQDKMSMNPRVKEVEADLDYTLLITFKNGEKKRFDVKPYLETGIFSELKEPEIFYSVKPFMGSIEWSNGADLCPDTLYLDGEEF